MTAPFVPARLRIARRLRNLTQQDLGNLVAVHGALIQKLEKGDRVPTDEVRAALADALRVRVEFFEQPVFDEFVEDECSFRRKRGASERLKKRILAQGTIFGDVVRYLTRRVSLPSFDIPLERAELIADAEAAAMRCRTHWGLGCDTPITSMVRVLERAGAVVTQLDAGAEDIDAFTRQGGVTVVVLNTAKGSSSRMRFDMAHELGHIVMHRGLRPDLDRHEPEAHRFASAFLLPAEGFGADFASLRRVDWPHLLELKRVWGASVQAIIVRAHELQLIDTAQYRRLYKALSAKNWRKGEPQEPASETPELVRLAFEWLETNKGETPWDVARALNIHPATLGEIAGIDVQPPPEPTKQILSLDQFRERRIRRA